VYAIDHLDETERLKQLYSTQYPVELPLPGYVLELLLKAIDLVDQLVSASLNLVCPPNQLTTEQAIFAPFSKNHD
jgi:hypothetical protein